MSLLKKLLLLAGRGANFALWSFLWVVNLYLFLMNVLPICVLDTYGDKFTHAPKSTPYLGPRPIFYGENKNEIDLTISNIKNTMPNKNSPYQLGENPRKEKKSGSDTVTEFSQLRL